MILSEGDLLNSMRFVSIQLLGKIFQDMQHHYLFGCDHIYDTFFGH